MEHDAKLRVLIKMMAHAAHTSGLSRLPLIVCAMRRMREAVLDPSIARRAEESISEMMMGAPASARGLLRLVAWVARSASIRSTALAEAAIPALCADSVKLAELDWQSGALTETPDPANDQCPRVLRSACTSAISIACTRQARAAH